MLNRGVGQSIAKEVAMSKSMETGNRSVRIATAVIFALTVAALPLKPASADNDNWHRHGHRGWVGGSSVVIYGAPGYYYAPAPVYIVPPPAVYYAPPPPPVYYVPTPAYYPRPSVGFSINLPLR
jgi:hypothetical protein